MFFARTTAPANTARIALLQHGEVHTVRKNNKKTPTPPSPKQTHQNTLIPAFSLPTHAIFDELSN